jgi:hypothetical protein
MANDKRSPWERGSYGSLPENEGVLHLYRSFTWTAALAAFISQPIESEMSR